MGENGRMTHDHIAQSADGTRIAWSRHSGGSVGQGSTVVLVHGITESAGSFDPIVDRLVDDRAVITLDLRGHGESGDAASYDLASMAGDVVAVIASAGLTDGVGAPEVHIVGHSLGGAVVSAVGSVLPVASVVDIDQSLQLAAFKGQLVAAEPMLRDPDQYQLVIGAMFEAMTGTLLPAGERSRVDNLRRPSHEVVLGVWDLLLTSPDDEIAAVVDAALAGYIERPTPYLSLFGLDPGGAYAEWLADRIPGSEVELWPEHGHYPHLVDPDRFVTRLIEFWGE
jgi:pimeloyl-ACP methyl ester carboxylesterase